jgi:chromosome partitioning protein
MITVAVVNTKGGVGKTTLAAALAVRASQERVSEGRSKTRPARVAMVDLDPMGSLAAWWNRRPKRQLKDGEEESPYIFTGASDAPDAVERAERDGWEWCFLDGPPAFLVTVEEMISAADFTLIPIKPSMADVLATQDTIVLARKSGKPFLCVINDVGPTEKVAEKIRQDLFSGDLRDHIAEADIVHRVSHIKGMNAGKSAAEVDGGRDKQAAKDIENLWKQVKAAAIKAAKARIQATEHAHG